MKVGSETISARCAIRDSEDDDLDLTVQSIRQSVNWTGQSKHPKFSVPLLHNGDAFPTLEVPAVGGGFVSLPSAVAGSYAVVLIYRGAWCPFCTAQLAEFGAEKPALDALGVKVVALSVDDEAAGAALVAKQGLGFPVGHDADADAIATATGAFTNAAPHYLQPTAFILGQDGLVMAAVYSTQAVGRLRATEVIKFVEFMKSRSIGQVQAAAE